MVVIDQTHVQDVEVLEEAYVGMRAEQSGVRVAVADKLAQLQPQLVQDIAGAAAAHRR
jgi:hypothetical protein